MKKVKHNDGYSNITCNVLGEYTTKDGNPGYVIQKADDLIATIKCILKQFVTETVTLKQLVPGRKYRWTKTGGMKGDNREFLVVQESTLLNTTIGVPVVYLDDGELGCFTFEHSEFEEVR